jgi:hypothetical protein
MPDAGAGEWGEIPNGGMKRGGRCRAVAFWSREWSLGWGICSPV